MSWNFDKDSYTLTISGTGDMYTITAESDGTYSNAPGWWMLPVKHIVVAEGVETLSEYAFAQADMGYYKLVESIQLPSTLKAIPDAFAFSENLKTLSIPEGVAELGGWLIGNPGSSFGDLDSLYLPSTLAKLDVATVILAGISEGSKIETTPDFPTIYFAGTQEQWDAVELVDTIHIVSGDSVMDNFCRFDKKERYNRQQPHGRYDRLRGRCC